jgi:hypothetical protein
MDAIFVFYLWKDVYKKVGLRIYLTFSKKLNLFADILSFFQTSNYDCSKKMKYY